MARVVVVGGGFGGMASAARLAKLGHEVTLCERLPQLGGALGFVTRGGFRWDDGPTSTMLPAVIRDLFRKSGRQLDRELELVPVDPVREHRFHDGTVVSLPGGSRAAQHDAVEAGLGGGLGQQWIDWTAGYADQWEVVRRDYLERPWSPDLADRATRDLLFSRATLRKSVTKAFKDERLRQLAEHLCVLDGHDPRNVPAWLGVLSYVEQNFGVWTVPGGMGSLTGAMRKRLDERRVDVRLDLPVTDLRVVDGAVTGVLTGDGEIEAERVVVAIDPRRLPALAPHVERTMPAIPPVVCHVGLVGEVPDLPHEVVLHGDPMLVLRTNGTVLDSAPEGASAAWTVLGRGKLAEDVLTALARHKIDIRAQVAVRVDRSPLDLVRQWGGSPLGVQWQGRRTLRDRMGTQTPIEGVYAAGAHTTPGAGLPFVGLSAALVAQSLR